MTDDRETEAYSFESDVPGKPDDPERTAFRRALSRYPTGVTVVTACAAGGAAVGITVNSFASVSLHPPLILWSLGEDSANAAAFLAAGRFAVNVLASDQEALARRFARSDAQQAEQAQFCEAREGVPVIGEALSIFECVREAVHPGGDHHILIGRVERFSSRPGRPLLFHEGGFGGLS